MRWRPPVLVCALALALAACGDNVGTTTRSGARLKLSWQAYFDGGRALADRELWDDARGESCVATTWTDGATYCTPHAETLITFYTDASCTTGRLLVESFGIPAYVATYRAVGGDVRLHTLSRADTAELAAYWILRDDGTCDGPFDGRTRDLYEAGAPVTASDLVRLRVMASTGNRRVVTRATAGDDGLYLPADFVDRELGVPCLLYAASDTAAFCVPAETGEIDYHDDACTRPVLVSGGVDRRRPRAISAGTMCQPRGFVVGVETSDAPAFTRIDEACVPSTPPGGPWFELREHPVATVPRARVATGERLEPIAMEIDSIAVLARELHDTATGEECTAIAEENTGGIRCLPRDVALVTSVFADAVCTVPIDVALVRAAADRLPCNGAATPRYARRSGDGRNVYELGAPRTAPTYRRVDGVCQLDTSTDYRLHELGAATPEDRWARGVVVRDG